MYLARLQTDKRIRYVIRHSYPEHDHFTSRDLFDLGPDPRRFIHYPGGNSYYFDSQVEEAIIAQGVEPSAADLDRIFFEFLAPEVQRVIAGFDRGFRNSPDPPSQNRPRGQLPPHIFDKRRYHYLRFGPSSQRYLHNVPDKRFKYLHSKSRDELECYFQTEERRLTYREIGPYIATIFRLSGFHPQSETGPPLLAQLDRYFLDQLCCLNDDAHFRSGTEPSGGLYPHLIRYALFWFDHEPVRTDPQKQYIRDFINRHRVYRPPPKTAAQIKEAEALFGHDWKTLKRMDGPALTRIFRKLALKHHPDQGGDAEAFRRVTHYYKTLMQRKSKK